MRDGQVVKGVQFRNHEVVGEIETLAQRYCQNGADELVFYDINASPDGRSVSREWIRRVAKVIDIPFCVAGGIRTVSDAEEVLENGSDKISINSPAIENPNLIDILVKRFGTQCVVVGIDSHFDGSQYRIYKNTGDPNKTCSVDLTTTEWITQVQSRGAGEIVLNCMNQDGVRQGYDLEQLTIVREICHVPLIASGGAGEMAHFRDVFEKTDVSGALAASVFHKNVIQISDLKHYLRDSGVEVRV